MPSTRALRALGTTAVVAVDRPEVADEAERLLRETLDALDRTCSRFRGDSEVAALGRAAGAPVAVSPLLFDVLSIAVEVAHLTGGAVDPTVGGCLNALGYDRDFDLLGALDSRHAGATGARAPVAAPGWWTIRLDEDARTVRITAGASIDLGSTAKAFAADASASLIAATTGAGTIVSLGGDVAVAGAAPPGGWRVGIAESSSAVASAFDETLSLTHGALATSSPGVRTWGPEGSRHHIVDPRTGMCASRFWRVASAGAPTCVEANAVTTAALVLGELAPRELAGLGYAMRLVRHDGTIVTLNGWPPGGAAV
jgi:thiamine biosynthesis lipoprotein